MKLIQAKSILTSNQGRGINVYRGCTHGCIYCDSRSLCYNTPVPFENIEVKANAAELLETELSHKRKKIMVGTGSMCDPYMPVEKNLELTRKCLEVIERHGFGSSILTKSDLILRDFDILKKINRKARAIIQMTLTTADENLCRIIEPNVCTTKRRIEVLMEAKKAGLETAVWLSPILPFINDTEENITSLLESCAQCGVKAIVIFGIGLTLRDGNREYFYKKLDQHFPGMKKIYEKKFGSSYEVGSPDSQRLMGRIRNFCSSHGIICTVKEAFEWMNRFEEKDLQPTLF